MSNVFYSNSYKSLVSQQLEPILGNWSIKHGLLQDVSRGACKVRFDKGEWDNKKAMPSGYRGKEEKTFLRISCEPSNSSHYRYQISTISDILTIYFFMSHHHHHPFHKRSILKQLHTLITGRDVVIHCTTSSSQ